MFGLDFAAWFWWRELIHQPHQWRPKPLLLCLIHIERYVLCDLWMKSLLDSHRKPRPSPGKVNHELGRIADTQQVRQRETY